MPSGTLGDVYPDVVPSNRTNVFVGPLYPLAIGFLCTVLGTGMLVDEDLFSTVAYAGLAASFSVWGGLFALVGLVLMSTVTLVPARKTNTEIYWAAAAL